MPFIESHLFVKHRVFHVNIYVIPKWKKVMSNVVAFSRIYFLLYL